MLVRFRRPAWAAIIVVVADAAFASHANRQLIQRRGSFFVMALARTGCFENGPALQALVTHLPKTHSRHCWVPLEEAGRRRTKWTYTKRADRRHIGDVTIVLSTPRRHDGPQATNILVSHLPGVTARQGVDVYRHRWAVELLIKALKGAMGCGQHQVTRAPQRLERSIAMAVMAYLVIVQVRAQDIPPRGSWSSFPLTRNFTSQRAQAQLERSVVHRLCKEPQQRRAA
jgi:hypothetical protein